jgi:dihydroorotase/N-acyl-D-amino-acid deacylase
MIRPTSLSALVLASAAGLACARSTPVTSPGPALGTGPYDVVIENGRIVDGTGAAWFYGDLAIRGDRIAAVAPRGTLRSAGAKTRIDARDLVVAPGFIDIQDQSGGNLLLGDGRQLGKITQGVTTGILGEGSTPAPLNPASLSAGANDLQKRFAEPHGFDAWLRGMEAHGISQNVGSFVGAGTIRVYGHGGAHGGRQRRGARLDARRGAPRHGRRRVRNGQRIDLSTEHVRDDGGADRGSESDGALRRRIHHTHAVRGRSHPRGH